VPPQSTEAIVSESVQEADLQGEGLQGTNAEAQATDVLEATQTAIAENETDIGITLIPSVEPEMLRNVMPNSWQKLARLTKIEGQAFVAENMDALLEIGGQMRNEPMGWTDDNEYKYYSVYRQEAGRDTFYRIIVTANDSPDFMSRAIKFVHILVYQNMPLLSRTYNSIYVSQIENIVSFSGIDIIHDKEGAKGIFTSSVWIEMGEAYDRNDWSVSWGGGQTAGRSRGRYYTVNDLMKKEVLPPNEIEIDVSDCLVDPAVPLRYGLQSAFDRNPATSYVANTKDGLFEIRFLIHNYGDYRYDGVGIPIAGITKLALINGYAQNEELYFANNRIKKITVPEETELADGTLGFQFVDFTQREQSTITVTELFKGEKYNDTCLAELNVKIDSIGWLFGDIDE
jgi:hypothetical protein